MLAYIIRRALYAIPVLIGVNLITFLLFFVVNTPDDIARMQLGFKRVTPEAIETWKATHGYDLPYIYNEQADGLDSVTETLFFQKSVKVLAFEFGRSSRLRLQLQFSGHFGTTGSSEVRLLFIRNLEMSNSSKV